MANELMNATAVSAAMANHYKLRPDKAQFTRFGETTKHFHPRKQKMRGEEMNFKVFTDPYTGVRRTSVGTGSESEFPKARQIGHKNVAIGWDDLCEFQATIEFTGLAREKTESRKDAVYRVAMRLVGEVDADFGETLNRSLHQTADCVMATVAAVYNEDGTTYTADAGQTDAFLQIDGGSISQFHTLQILDIREASDNDDVQVTVVVNDVYHTSDGPGDATGPGIVVTIADENSGDETLDNIADGDEIVLSGETDDNFAGFPTWFSTDSVFDITRTSKGSHWAVPYMWDFKEGGAPVTLDLEEHFGQVAEELAYAIRFGRKARVTEGITLTDYMLAIGTPRLVAEAARQGGDDVRFTADLDGEVRKKLFARSGYEGHVWHSPTLGPVALQGDPVAVPHTIRFLEPSSWFWITGHDGSESTVEWLDKDGSRWHYKHGTNGRLVNRLEAGCLTRVGLGCDQPKANVSITGVKSSRES